MSYSKIQEISMEYLPPSFFTSYRSWQRSPKLCSQNYHKHESLTALSFCSRSASLSMCTTEASHMSCRHSSALRSTSPLAVHSVFSQVSQPCQPFLKDYLDHVYGETVPIIASGLLGAAYALDAQSSSPVLRVYGTHVGG